VFVYIYLIINVGTSLPKPSNQPKLSAKEEEYFDAMETRKSRERMSRLFYNVDKEGGSIHEG